MPTVILVRHGRSTSNAAGTLAGRTPGIFLDDTGQEQAHQLGKRFQGLTVDRVVSSPMERCQQTAETMLKSAGITADIITDERIIESDYGSWSGQLLSDLAKEPDWATVQKAPSQASFPGGEKMLDVRDRMVAAIEEHAAAVGPTGVVVLVSHGDLINGALSWYLGMDFDHVQRLSIDPASASVIHLIPASDEHPAVVRVPAVNSVAGPLSSWVMKAPSHDAQVGGGVGATGTTTAQSEPTKVDS